jgi:hypothetical protein
VQGQDHRDPFLGRGHWAVWWGGNELGLDVYERLRCHPHAHVTSELGAAWQPRRGKILRQQDSV